MNKKKIMIVVAALICVILLCVGVILIGQLPEKIDKAQNNYGEELYSYSTYEQSPDIKVDGVLDEEVWKGKKWFKNTYLSNTSGTMPSMELTAFPTEYGVYIASVVYDKNLTNNGQRAPESNSCWELYLSACDVGEDLFSKKYDGEWTIKRIYVDMVGDSFTFFSNFDRAITVDGKLNSGETTSATLEMFVAWETLGVDTSKGIPKSFGIIPCYRAVLTSGSDTTWMAPYEGSALVTYMTYLYDANGYINADEEGNIVGDGYYGYAKSKGWNLANEKNGVIETSRGGWEQIFFSEHYGENYIVEATMIPKKAVNDSYPKAGISFLQPNGTIYTIFLDGGGENGLVDSVNETKNFPSYSLITLNTTGGWNQVALLDYDSTNPNAAKQEGVKLTVVKYGDYFWYFADGKFLTSEKVSYMAGDCMPGLFSLGMHVIYKDYSCQEIDEEWLVDYLAKHELYLIDATASGSGGTIEVNKESVKKGGSYELTITTENGYRVAAVEVNGKNILSDVSKRASEGVYTVKNVTSDHKVEVKFEKCEELTYSGLVTYEGEGIPATLVLEGITDKSLYYVYEASAKKGFNLQIPTGSYHLLVQTEEYQDQRLVVKLNGDKQENIEVKLSTFAKEIMVNGVAVESALDKYDLTYESSGKVYGSSKLGTHGDGLYFHGSGTDFLAHVVLNYSSDFVAGTTYQKDLFGGFKITNGTESFDIWARDTGIVYTGEKWNYIMGLFGKSVLTYPNPATAELSIAKLGDYLYVYFEGKEVYKAVWSEIAPSMSYTDEFAVGLDMYTDKEAELEFKNYSVSYDSNKVKSYVNSH